MTGFPLHVLGLVLAALWLLARPRAGRRTLLLLAWVGLLLMQLVPGVLFSLLDRPRDSSEVRTLLGALAVVSAVGSLLVLRAFLGLVLWDRPRGRRLRLWAGLFALGFIWNGLGATGAWGWRIVLALPFLWSFRWRADLGAGSLTLAALTGLVSIPLADLRFGLGGRVLPQDWALAVRGAGTFVESVISIVWLYGFLSLTAAASRVHVSIRRIGPRLVGSHLLAGVVPVLLVALFLLLSGALFLSTYRGSIGVRILRHMSEQARSRMESAASAGEAVSSPFGSEMPGQIVLERRGSGPVEVLQRGQSFPADSVLFKDKLSPDAPLLWDGRTLFVRAVFEAAPGGDSLRLEALAPLDSLGMVRIGRIAGVPIRVNPGLVVERKGGGLQIGPPRGGAEGGARADSARSDRSRPIGPSGGGRGELPGGAILSCLRWDGREWATTMIPVTSSAPLGEQILSLFSVREENPIASVVLVVLGVILALFFAAIWITSAMVLTMGRSIARAVRALSDATAALGRGGLDHRIALEGKDELWDVAASFNRMAEELERNRARELEARRLEEELRLARAIQDRLLPAGPPVLDGLDLAGASLPAREVGGDYFDYLPQGDRRVGIAIADVSGKGAPAALLMSSFRASLRSQDLARLGPAEVLARVNRFLHESVEPGRFITAFLGLIDAESGELRFASAGHDPPVLLHADGKAVEIAGGGLVLGVLPDAVYEETVVALSHGSLLVAFTDGVTEARSPDGEFFGTERIVETLRSWKGESCAELLRRMAERVKEFAGDAPQADDITILLARRR